MADLAAIREDETGNAKMLKRENTTVYQVKRRISEMGHSVMRDNRSITLYAVLAIAGLVLAMSGSWSRRSLWRSSREPAPRQ